MQIIRRAGWLLVFGISAGCSAGMSDEPEENVAEAEEALRIGGVCGGPRDRSCDDDEYCRTVRPGRCPGPRAVGLCLSRPEVCTRIFAPVCGCDGVTYPNRCEANAAGASVEHEGECEGDFGPFCGGIAGIACPGSAECVDDPRDECDPNAGGADCGGVCECNIIGLCPAGERWDSSPEVCGCVPDANPCAAVLCEVGSQCVVVDGEGVCIPNRSPCGDTTCTGGTVCCNASCGICTPPGFACIQIACVD